MNAMVHDMTWDVIEEKEGSNALSLSQSEVEEVSGGFVCGGWCITGIVVAVIGAGGLGYWANRV